MASFDALRGLPLEIDGYALERRESQSSSGFLRVSTEIVLRGDGEEGRGEDVTYAPEDHDTLLEAGAVLPLAGSWTFESFSARVGELDLFPAPPQAQTYRNYRRWGFESAALDLALRQSRTTLHAALRREPAPVTFVASVRLPEPPDLGPVLARLAQQPGLRFKLDPTPAWDDALIAQLAARDLVATADLKGFYSGTAVDNAADPELYRRIAEGLPAAWIEDPLLDERTTSVLAPHVARITWDAPIHSVADVLALPFPPRTLNSKPSRFGSVRALLEFYDHCGREGIALYGGGQTELGVGRGQIQYLASMFHPGTPNDVAPSAYNEDPLPASLPASPLAPSPSATGFRWDV